MLYVMLNLWVFMAYLLTGAIMARIVYRVISWNEYSHNTNQVISLLIGVVWPIGIPWLITMGTFYGMYKLVEKVF